MEWQDTGLWILDLWPLFLFLKYLNWPYKFMRTTPFRWTGKITWRLQRRHLISTPSATIRASKLPQQHRSGVSDFAASTVFFC